MLKKLGGIAKQKDDKAMRFNVALLSGDIESRIESLKESGQIGLAYLTAQSHGLDEVAAGLKEQLGDKNIILPSMEGAGEVLKPPSPVFGPFPEHQKYDWPRKDLEKGFFDQVDVPIKSTAEAEMEARFAPLSLPLSLSLSLSFGVCLRPCGLCRRS